MWLGPELMLYLLCYPVSRHLHPQALETCPRPHLHHVGVRGVEGLSTGVSPPVSNVLSLASLSSSEHQCQNWGEVGPGTPCITALGRGSHSHGDCSVGLHSSPQHSSAQPLDNSHFLGPSSLSSCGLYPCPRPTRTAPGWRVLLLWLRAPPLGAVFSSRPPSRPHNLVRIYRGLFLLIWDLATGCAVKRGPW